MASPWLYDKDTDPMTNAVLLLQEMGGWEVTDADGDGIWLRHPGAGSTQIYMEADIIDEPTEG